MNSFDPSRVVARFRATSRKLFRPKLIFSARIVTNSTSPRFPRGEDQRSEEHTSELQSRLHLVCRLLLEKKKITVNEADALPELRRADGGRRHARPRSDDDEDDGPVHGPPDRLRCLQPVPHRGWSGDRG